MININTLELFLFFIVINSILRIKEYTIKCIINNNLKQKIKNKIN